MVDIYDGDRVEFVSRSLRVVHKMVSFNAITTGGLTVCFAVSLYRCNEYHDNYSTLFRKLKGEGFHVKDKTTSYLRPYFVKKNDGCYKGDHEEQIESLAEANESPSDPDKVNSVFLQGMSDLKRIYEMCQKKITQRFKKKLESHENFHRFKERITLTYNCMKVFGFRHLDEHLSDDVIPITDDLAFVRDLRNGTTREVNPTSNKSRVYVSDLISKNWIDLAIERIEKLFLSHALKIRLDKNAVVEGRGRRRDHRMFAMMMMGFVIMASILVPMGFQFLTVLGGKSLLMAKMALIMSAINGLKKIATSNVGYGLYHAPDTYHHDPHHHHAFHEKIFHIKASEPPNAPFNVVI